MAANLITINSQFRPFSFQEMLQPYQLYGQAYTSAEQGLQALQEKAGELDSLKNNEGDINAYNQYKGYSDNLKSQIDALTRGGLSPSIRSGLLQSRTDYSKNIMPIVKQVTKRDQLIQQQNQMQAQNPAIRFDNDYRTVGIDRMMQNPQMGYRSVDLDKITSQVGTLASKLASSKLTEPKYRHILNGMFWQQVQQSGWAPEQIASYIASGFGQGAPKELQDLYKSTLTTAGKGWTPDVENEIIGAVNKGMLLGIGSKSYSNPIQDPQAMAALELQNYAAKKNIDYNMYKRQLAESQGLNGGGASHEDAAPYYGTPLHLPGREDNDKIVSNASKIIGNNKYWKNGKFMSWQEFRKGQKEQTPPELIGMNGENSSIYNDWKNALKSLRDVGYNVDTSKGIIDVDRRNAAKLYKQATVSGAPGKLYGNKILADDEWKNSLVKNFGMIGKGSKYNNIYEVDNIDNKGNIKKGNYASLSDLMDDSDKKGRTKIQSLGQIMVGGNKGDLYMTTDDGKAFIMDASNVGEIKRRALDTYNANTKYQQMRSVINNPMFIRRYSDVINGKYGGDVESFAEDYIKGYRQQKKLAGSTFQTNMNTINNLGNLFKTGNQSDIIRGSESNQSIQR